MNAYKKKLFFLQLSFIRWYILIPFTFGLILIYVIQYLNATFFEFYDTIKQEKEPVDIKILDANIEDNIKSDISENSNTESIEKE